MKKIFFLSLLLLFFGATSSHPGDDLDSSSGCHVCKTNCNDYGLSYGEFHCHKTTLEKEIQAIQSYYSFRGFGRSSSVNDAIEKAKLKYSKNTIDTPSFNFPSYTPPPSSSNTILESYDKIIEYLKLASEYDKLKDYSNEIVVLNKALPYAKNISTEEENILNSLIKSVENKKIIEDFINAFNYCVSIYGDFAYGINNSGVIVCSCIEGYTLDKFNKKCINTEYGELSNVISWMYNNGLTSYNTVYEFMGDDYLTREQASKFFVEFAKKILLKEVDTSIKINLKDIKKSDKTLQIHIKESNQLGLFKGTKGYFLPFNKLTIAQALAVIIRATDGQQNENNNERYYNYFNIADKYGILDGLGFDYYKLDSTNIKRKEVALLLYRLTNKIKNN